jgi:N utilization substance protein A
VIIEAIESALETASRKTDELEDVRVAIDRKTLALKAYIHKKVVIPPAICDDQIALNDARRINPLAAVGDLVEVEADRRVLAVLGRISAQTAKQTIMQKLRAAEKEKIFEQYKGSVGDIVMGTVRRFERNDVVIELEFGEALMPSKERIITEDYAQGERIRAYVVAVKNKVNGPEITLSRSHPNFVRRLFELEASEIADGTVEIMAIAREAGFRTKMAVQCHDEHVDPVGACVGMRGMRVKNIVRELNGEKVDIVRWSDNIKTLVTNALAPAKLSAVTVDEPTHTVTVLVEADQLSLAIGKRGQNARLTAKMTGWRVDIQKKEHLEELDFEQQIERAVETLAKVDGVGYETAEKLVFAGFLTMEGIMAADISDLAEIEEFTAEEAQQIWKAVEKAYETEHGKIDY